MGSEVLGTTELNNIKTELLAIGRVRILVNWRCSCFLKLSPTNEARILCPTALEFQDPNACEYRLWIQSHRYGDTERQFTGTLYQKGIRGRRGPNRATYESSLSSEVIILQISWLATVTMLTTPKTNEERRMHAISSLCRKTGANSPLGNSLKVNY